MNITGKGMKFRWLNNAGFEMELSSGKHLLVDPWLDEAQKESRPQKNVREGTIYEQRRR